MSYGPVAPPPALAALGQLGGAWGWYSTWDVRGSRSASFSGWIYTDQKTAQMLARAAKGSIEVNYRVTGGPSTGAYGWNEIQGIYLAPGAWGAPSPTHVSWFYAEASGATAVTMALQGYDQISLRDQSWNLVR